MTRGDMRTRWRARVKEVTADIWTDGEANTYLNLGLQEVQKKIIAVDPMAFFWIDRGDVYVPAAGSEALYPWPEGMLYEFEVGLWDGSKYVPLERIPYMEAQGRSSPAYAPHGRYFLLCPAPSAIIANGLQVKYMPTLTMSADADVPKIPQALHMAAVIYAERFALGDTGEVESRDAATKELAEIIGGIPQFFLPSASTPNRIVPDVALDY